MRQHIFLLLSTIFLLCGLSLHAQQKEPSSTYRHELSVSGVGMYHSSLLPQQLGLHPRLMYRRHWQRTALRVQADFGQYKRNASGSGMTNYQTLGLMIGLEYKLSLGRFSITPFVDLGFRAHEYTWLPNIEIVFQPPYTPAQINGISGRAGLAIHYQITDRWRIGLESSYSYTYGMGYDQRDFPPACDSCGHLRTWYWHGQASISPVGAFWISYAFGAKASQ
ncbi:MAG: hypothetical protein AAFQ87_23210 [Bacteroidota bacterium]